MSEEKEEQGPKKLHEYSSDEISVRYERKLCTHAAECVQGLPEVFNPKKRRWISPEKTSAAKLIEVINKCPSGALTYQLHNEPNQQQPAPVVTIRTIPNGALVVTGNLEITLPDGTTQQKPKASFCRCGASKNKPYCDGTHRDIGFEAD